MINGRSPGSAIRVWVAGCATGEEAYSIAISLLEYLDDRPENLSIKVLATDLNEVALEKARAGIYLDNIEIDVSPARLRRFFVRQEGYYQISKAVRELCIFSRHNMSADPPFSRLDLISCRNVLIYMDVALQRRVIPLLHYALNSERLPVPRVVRERQRVQRTVRRRGRPQPILCPIVRPSPGCRSTSTRRDRRGAGPQARPRRCLPALERPGCPEGSRPGL